tara:strand:- start:75 stop:422 length:348 start_codon:yes stop_codon:yes gene_type:complete
MCRVPFFFFVAGQHSRRSYAHFEQVHSREVFQAVEYFVAMPHDLVISDINMPTKDGVVSLLELKTDYPDIKLIAISGEDQAQLDTAKEFGAKRAIAKPFSPLDLVKVVDEVLAEE